FDARSLDAGPSGTKTRLLRLAPELARRGSAVAVLHAPELDAAARAALGGCRLLETAGPARGALRRAFAARRRHAEAARAFAPDVVVAETWPMPPVAPAALIAVVHDLRRLERFGPSRALFRRWLATGAAAATRVHAVSETVAAALRAAGVAEGKIDVVPNAVDVLDAERLKAATPPDLGGRFVLVAGHAEPRKDHALAAAVARAIADLGVVVVRVGRGRLRSPAVRDLGVVDDAVRDALFLRAEAVLAPSRLEGFGLAPLEAAAAGGRVVASDIPAHRETLGEAADYFAVGDVDEAARHVRAACLAGALERAGRAHQARARAALWSPMRAAEAFEASLARLRPTPSAGQHAGP
ncbi:MAG TPA: glycosyltransferase, partial [Planctomycetota bacterium]|nr:glycosyltransferase [Planctomycetota bacterium]